MVDMRPVIPTWLGKLELPPFVRPFFFWGMSKKLRVYLKIAKYRLTENCMACFAPEKI